MNQREILERIFPTAPIPLHVIEPTTHGLLLSGGSALHWPDEKTGAVLLFDFEGELENEFWPDDEVYRTLMELFKQFPGPKDIVERPRLRVVRFEDDDE